MKNNNTEKEPVEEKFSYPNTSDFQGVDKDPEEEQQKGKNEKVAKEDLKGKEVDRRI